MDLLLFFGLDTRRFLNGTVSRSSSTTDSIPSFKADTSFARVILTKDGSGSSFGVWFEVLQNVFWVLGKGVGGTGHDNAEPRWTEKGKEGWKGGRRQKHARHGNLDYLGRMEVVIKRMLGSFSVCLH